MLTDCRTSGLCFAGKITFRSAGQMAETTKRTASIPKRVVTFSIALSPNRSADRARSQPEHNRIMADEAACRGC